MTIDAIRARAVAAFRSGATTLVTDYLKSALAPGQALHLNNLPPEKWQEFVDFLASKGF